MTLTFLPDPPTNTDLLAFCETDRQREVIGAIIDIGNVAVAARHLQADERHVRRILKLIRERAAKGGVAPGTDNMTSPIPEGFAVKRRSARFDKDGNAAGGWVISEPDKERQAAAIREAFASMAEELPRLAPMPPPETTVDALCNLYTLTDSHVGMLAWRKEGGADWDISIAERTLTGCFEQMVMGAPAARSCIVNQLGDWMHSDGLLPVTPTSGHVLDQDGRFSKMVSAAIRILRRVIDLALARHETVYVVMAEGNHDLASSVWLRLMFAALYENEPRVQVIDSELPYYVHVHGETLLAFHHGHLKKNGDLPLLFAAQYPREWGATTKRYAHTGHRHHEEVKEHSGMKVVQHSTLAARDAYAARGGWMSERQATAYTYHRTWGQVGSNTVTPEMLEAA